MSDEGEGAPGTRRVFVRSIALAALIAPLACARSGEIAAVGMGGREPTAVIAASCAVRNAPTIGRLGAVAFIRSHALHVVDLVTRRDRTLVTPAQAPGGIRTVRWSPDGRWIAFGSGEVVSSSGGPPCLPLGQPLVSWSWSPTADELVGTTPAGGLLAGGPGIARRVLLPDGWGVASYWAPVFDPTGGAIAVDRVLTGAAGIPARGSVWIVDSSNGHAKELLGRRGALPLVAGWSPDARWILWWNDIQFSASIAADGLALRATSIDGVSTRTVASPVLVHRDFLSWCGDRLVVAAGGFRDVRSGKRLIEASAPDWHATELSRDPSRDWIWPSCSPDGRWVATTAGIPPPPQELLGKEQRGIWLLSSDGTRRHRLVGSSDTHANDVAFWSRDGRSILFVHRRLGATPQAFLFFATIDPTTGRLLSEDSPIAYLGRARAYEVGYGYYSWTERTDWYQPRP